VAELVKEMTVLLMLVLLVDQAVVAGALLVEQEILHLLAHLKETTVEQVVLLTAQDAVVVVVHLQLVEMVKILLTGQVALEEMEQQAALVGLL
jgi:hypothetical protein